MARRPQSRVVRASLYRGGRARSQKLQLIEEEPLQIFLQEKPWLVTMRTPGGERELAAGLCLSEGLVVDAADFERIGYDDLAAPNRVDVWLRPGALARARKLLGRSRRESQTSCGICGKRLIEHLLARIQPLEDGLRLEGGKLRRCLPLLEEKQRLYRLSRSAHAALLLDEKLRALSFAEDVGRHNALDKAIGCLLLEERLVKAKLAVLSSRVSYELVQKAARARLPVVISASRPTALAVRVAETLGLTLAFMRGKDLAVVCGPQRIATGRSTR